MGKELGTGDQRDLLPITSLQFLGSKEMARLSSSAALSSQQRILEKRAGQRWGQQAGSKLESVQAVGLGPQVISYGPPPRNPRTLSSSRLPPLTGHPMCVEFMV